MRQDTTVSSQRLATTVRFGLLAEANINEHGIRAYLFVKEYYDPYSMKTRWMWIFWSLEETKKIYESLEASDYWHEKTGKKDSMNPFYAANVMQITSTMDEWLFDIPAGLLVIRTLLSNVI